MNIEYRMLKLERERGVSENLRFAFFVCFMGFAGALGEVSGG